MLYSFDKDKPVSGVPYQKDFTKWLSRLTSQEIDAITNELNHMIDTSKGDVHTSSWMPGSDWSNTVFEPIWSKAALHSHEDSAKCFGLMVFDTFMRRPEWWGFGRFKLDSREIRGLTYFKLKASPVK
jgi:hypothetical protein